MCHTHSIPEMMTQRVSTCELLSTFMLLPSLSSIMTQSALLYIQFLKSEMVDLRMCDIHIGELEQEMAAKVADFERKTEDLP